MRFSTCLLPASLLLLGTACSSMGAATAQGADGGNMNSGGSTAAGAGAGNSTSSGGSGVPQAGSTSSASGAPSTSGGSGGSAAGSGGTAPVGVGGSGGAPTLTANAQVLTWVPPYHISGAKQMLSGQYGTLSAADGISQLALQFWVTNGGSINLSGVSEADVTWFHDWARQHGVQILLCVDNFVGDDWNWPEAERSFIDNGPAFAASIASEIAKRDFDGVNVDLEGIVTASAADQAGYLQLAKNLAAALHPLGKVVTVDSFHGPYNAPNWNWWPDLMPVVDGITTMGYEQSGLTVDYQTLTDHSMPHPEKLTLGVPGYKDNWQGNTVTEQLTWIVNQGKIGVGIWDASFGAAGWSAPGVWAQLKTIKAR